MKRISKEYMVGMSALLIVIFGALGFNQVDWQALAPKPPSGERNYVASGPFKVSVTLSPETPVVGDNQITIAVLGKDDTPVTAANVRAVAEMPAMGSMPAMHAQADLKEVEPGVYTGHFNLPMAGEWPLAVDVATSDDQHVDLTFDMATGRSSLTLATATPEGDVAYHTCSMHPSVKSATPGTCPICGMDLVPVTHEELKSGSIMVDDGRRQLIGVKTASLERRDFSIPVRLQGDVTFDPTRLTDISLRFDGWIGELDADFEGKLVKKGEEMFAVYSPELLTLQEEFLETLSRSRESSRQAQFLAAARKRLLLWGLTEKQLNWLSDQKAAQDYVPIFAPADGFIIQKNIVSGSSFKKGDRLLRLADLSVVWVEAYAYEHDLPLLAEGMSAAVTLPNLPGEQIEATVSQINPFMEGAARTAKVRLAVNNGSGLLKPGLFANVWLFSNRGSQLLIPESAVLVSGEKRVAFLDLGEGRIKPKIITVGAGDGDFFEVLSGLQDGDVVITSGNFLIASESKLKAGIDQW